MQRPCMYLIRLIIQWVMVYEAVERKNSGESSGVFTSCSGWVGLDCFPFPSMCADSQNV